MPFRGSIEAAALIVALLTATAAQAFDDAKYPNLKGQWHRAEGNAGAGRFDPTKPPGRLQEVPLTAEYQAIYEGNLADKEAGGQGSEPTGTWLAVCLLPGALQCTTHQIMMLGDAERCIAWAILETPQN